MCLGCSIDIVSICANKDNLYIYIYFFREDDLLTCKNKNKTKKQQHNNTRAQGTAIDNISLALMKQFNYFQLQGDC